MLCHEPLLPRHGKAVHHRVYGKVPFAPIDPRRGIV
jgi:hypothetical protein